MPRIALHWQILIAMLLGAGAGVGLNALSGRLALDQPIEHGSLRLQSLTAAQPVDVPPGRFWSSDSAGATLIQVCVRAAAADDADDDATAYTTRRVIVADRETGQRLVAEPGQRWPPIPPQAEGDDEIPVRIVPALSELAAKDPQAFALFHQYGRSQARMVGDVSQALGDLFLRMLKMVSLPLIITSLISGVTGLGDAERLGKMFGRTVLYYLSTSMLAICIGLAAVNVIQPGVGANAPPADPQGAAAGQDLGNVLFQQVQNMIPTNPFAAAAEGQFLSIIAFSLAFGVCTILVGGAAAERISSLVDAAFQVMMHLTMLIIKLAPVGVFFLMLSATATQGATVFGTLGWYMLAVACALLLHAAVVLPAILYFVARRNPAEYAQAMSPALLTAFSSASSNGTLPLTLTCVEQRAGISNRVGSFVLPLGATINMDGTALYEVVAVLFIAQMSNVELTFAQQIVVAFTALLASVGAAGIPHAGLVMMVIILQAVGLPTESQGLIIAVDRVLDMARTAVNVWSDSCGCAVVARFEASGEAIQTAPASASGDIAL